MSFKGCAGKTDVTAPGGRFGTYFLQSRPASQHVMVSVMEPGHEMDSLDTIQSNPDPKATILIQSNPMSNRTNLIQSSPVQKKLGIYLEPSDARRGTANICMIIERLTVYGTVPCHSAFRKYISDKHISS